MIITKLQGGLANQLFQWAYGKSLSEKYNTPLYLDLNLYTDKHIGDTRRDYSLIKFPNFSNSPLTDKSLLVGRGLHTLRDNFIFSDINYDDNLNYYLDGYWQSEKYFKEFESVIKEELKPNQDILDKLNKTPFINKNVVSMHIRRTDYTTSNGYHPVQTIDYYKRGLEVIGDYDYIFVFSDDIPWCKENLKFENMVFMEGFDDVEDLWLMSMCKNNIIANSSFSWWGAWLNSNPDKKVIAPSNWFGERANLNTSDIIPSEWIKI
jgi:hypothetical protein